MIKPERLRKGDKVAIVSLSSGILGEDWAIHKLDIAKERLEKDFGLNVVVMPNALKGINFLDQHPELRAKDLMDAFQDKSIKAIFNAVGGGDTIRLLPYIDFDIIKNNPKIFTGFSDTTVNHFMMQKAGIISYYGASLMNNWAEYIQINDYTLDSLNNIFFNPKSTYAITPSSLQSFAKDIVRWNDNNKNIQRKFYQNKTGYEVLNGSGKVCGELLGGCIYTFIDMIGTVLWPSVEVWKNKILMIETSDNGNILEVVKWILHNLEAQGVLSVIKGIIVGTHPYDNEIEEYKNIIKKIIVDEGKHKDLPIIYNVNFGHAEPIAVFPLGVRCEIDCDNKTITLLEPATR